MSICKDSYTLNKNSIDWWEDDTRNKDEKGKKASNTKKQEQNESLVRRCVHGVSPGGHDHEAAAG